METGLRHRGDFERGEYDRVTELIDPEIVADHWKRRYGAELDAPEFYLEEEKPLARRIAHRFMYIHLKVSEERIAKAVDNADDAAPSENEPDSK
jgi:uncharacterized membrane protein